MPTPLVTVVIPTYNRAHFLREAIDSVLNQTFSDFEIFISDNASTDNTAEVVASYNDPRIRYHRQPTNIGLTPNWQFVVHASKTKYVALLPDDDLYLPDHLEAALNALAQYPEAAYYLCPAEYFGNGTSGLNYPSIITDIITPLLYFPPTKAVTFLGLDHPGPMNTLVCRRTAFEDIFWGRPDYLPQDLLVMVQLMARQGFIFGNQVTSRYRLHSSNISRPLELNKVFKAKLDSMLWYGIRYLAQFLLDINNCTLSDIEAHGLHCPSERQVIPLVLSLGSFDSSTELYRIAKRVFQARVDMDQYSSRFRLARRLGFMTIPLGEKFAQFRGGWRP